MSIKKYKFFYYNFIDLLFRYTKKFLHLFVKFGLWIKNSILKSKYWILLVLIIFILPNSGLFYLNRGWLFGERKEVYLNTTVMNIAVGGLNEAELENKINEIKSNFDNRQININYGGGSQSFKSVDLGISLDIKGTTDSVWKSNDVNFLTKYYEFISGREKNIRPTISFDGLACSELLSMISIPETKPINASIEYEQKLNIIEDVSGSKFSPVFTCEDIQSQIADDVYNFDANFETLPASIKKADIETKLLQIENMMNQELVLNSNNYELRLSPRQLFEMIVISKNNSELVVDWNQDRLNELIDSIATSNDTYTSAPSLGTCQYLASNGGYRLDKVATQKIFDNLKANFGASRSYDLKIDYYDHVIGERRPVSSSGSPIYLTFDDGMIYANQIMNYASCYGVKVTFFEIGSRAYSDADAIRRAVNEGHAVQSHGFEHAAYDYGSHSYQWQVDDMKKSIDTITAITGIRPTYFRPPGGNRSADTYSASSANGLNLILWGVSSVDTYYNDPTSICNQVLSGAYSGASVLMHSSKLATANAVPCIIEGLAGRGYSMQALR